VVDLVEYEGAAEAVTVQPSKARNATISAKTAASNPERKFDFNERTTA
jgi:hypothetical protein